MLERAETLKRERDHSMSGQGPKDGSREPTKGQGKAGTVNATLREAQSLRGVTETQRRKRLTRKGTRRTDPTWQLSSCCHVRAGSARPSYEGRGMKRQPNPVVSPASHNYGIACSWPAFPRPVWQRSRNITQTLGVMPETAPMGDGWPYKSGVTRTKAKSHGGSAAVLYQGQSVEEHRFC